MFCTLQVGEWSECSVTIIITTIIITIITIIITIFIIITIINLGFGLTLLHRQPSGSGLPRTLVGTGVSEGVTGNNYFIGLIHYFDPG